MYEVEFICKFLLSEKVEIYGVWKIVLVLDLLIFILSLFNKNDFEMFIF